MERRLRRKSRFLDRWAALVERLPGWAELLRRWERVRKRLGHDDVVRMKSCVRGSDAVNGWLVHAMGQQQ